MNNTTTTTSLPTGTPCDFCRHRPRKAGELPSLLAAAR